MTVASCDAATVSKPSERPLYRRPHEKVYPRKRAKGRFRRIKWAVLVGCLLRSTTSRPGCAGTAARTRPTRPC